MSEQILEPASEVLRREEEALQGRRSTMALQLRDLDRQLRRVQAARRMLTVPRFRRQSGASGRQAVTAVEVKAMIERLRLERPSATTDEIVASITDGVRRDGRSLAGLHLRLARALRVVSGVPKVRLEIPPTSR